MFILMLISIIPFRGQPIFLHQFNVRNHLLVNNKFKGAPLGDTIVLGITTYDWQSYGRHIYYDSGALAGYELTGIAWQWSDSPGPNFVNMHTYYWSVVTGTAGPIQSTYSDYFRSLDYDTAGKVIISIDCNGPSVAYETGNPGYGAFGISECPPLTDSVVFWPMVGVDASDNVLVLSKTYQSSGYSRLFYTRTVWDSLSSNSWSPWVLLDTCGYGLHNLVASKQSNKFAAAYEYSAIVGETDPGRLARDGHLYVKVSTDGGANWQPPIDINQFLPPKDSLNHLKSPSPFFDDMDSLHLVFLSVLGTDLGYWLPSSAINLWHWSKETGLTKVAEYGWTPYNVIGYDWDKIEGTYYLDNPSIGENTGTKDLFVVYHTFPWDECDPVDSAQTGEIYIVRSRDNGKTWGVPVDITNSPNHSEVFPSIPLYFQGDTVRISYLDDIYGGSYVYYGVDTIMANNPYVYMKVPIPPDGDVGVDTILSPQGSITPLVDTITPKAVIENFSSIDIPVQVKCLIYVSESLGYGYDEVYTDLIYDTLPPFTQDIVVFNQWVPDTFYGVDSTWYVKVSVAYLGDINTENDTLVYWSGICENTSQKRIDNYLLNIYPNPFMKETVIRYSISAVRGKGLEVSVKVYDIAGRLRQTLVDKEQTSGYYKIPFKTDKYPSGIYFLRFQAGEYKKTEKMVIIK